MVRKVFYIEGTQVKIPSGACANKKRLTEADLSNARLIGPEAFNGCLSLSKVHMPEQLEVLGQRTFYRCKSLKEITLPSNLRQIGPKAFGFCGFSQVVLPDGLEVIADEAFRNCKSLTSVVVPASVRTVGNKVFSGCPQLEKITFLGDPGSLGEHIVNKDCQIFCNPGGSVERYARENEYTLQLLE